MTGDMFGDLFGSPQGFPYSQPPRPSRPAPKKKVEKGPDGGWHAKVIDGQYYVPLAEVANLLRANDVLPAVRKGIDRRVEAQEIKAKMDVAPPKPETIEDVETGLCNGVPGQLHPFCIVGDHRHEAHMVEVTRKGK